MTRYVYIAAPLFSVAERAFNEELATRLRAKGILVFLPQRECANLDNSHEIYQVCRKGVRDSCMVIAVLDGADAEAGTAWECGLAAGLHKSIVGLRTDFRLSGETKGYNTLLYHSCTIVVNATGHGWFNTLWRAMLADKGIRATLSLFTDIQDIEPRRLMRDFQDLA